MVKKNNRMEDKKGHPTGSRSERTQAARAASLDLVERSFLFTLSFLALLSLQLIFLLGIEQFTPAWVSCSGVLSLLLATLVVGRVGTRGSTQGEWGALVVLLLAVALRCNPASILYGGQDPGVYANTAGYFANRGTWVIRDEMIPILSDRPDLHEYYIQEGYRVKRRPDGRWRGLLLPGFYAVDAAQGIFMPQFYHLHPAWLAVGTWIFGAESHGWILVFFSTLTVLGAYFVTRRLTSSIGAALSVGILLAINPAHSYFGTYPVSEAIAGFFFMSTLYLFLRRWYALMVLSYACFCLTRITGFIFVAMAMPALWWIVVKARSPRLIWTGVGVWVVYAASFYWGLAYSPNYAMAIYGDKLRVSREALNNAWVFFVAAGALFVGAAFLGARARIIVRGGYGLLYRYRTALVVVAVAALLTYVGYQGYLMGYTDHFRGHRWYDRRWHLVAREWDSLRALSLYTLFIMLSPLGFLAFIFGLIVMGKRAVLSSRIGVIFALTYGFLVVLTVKQLTTPYLYYYGRYLVSELVPLACIVGSVGLASLPLRTRKSRVALWGLYVGGCALLLVAPIKARLSFAEGGEFTLAAQCLGEASAGRTVVFIDQRHLSSPHFETPLRLTYDRLVFPLTGRFLSDPHARRELFQYFQLKGFQPLVLSSQDEWEREPGASRVTRVKARVRALYAQRTLPTQVGSGQFIVSLYSLGERREAPKACRVVQVSE